MWQSIDRLNFNDILAILKSMNTRAFRKILLRRFINFWPPFWGAGIRVIRFGPDLTSVEVEMKLKFSNANYVGTQFGGSLYAMTDPFYMLILIENLGPNYVVWDKAATIRFKSPGVSRVHAKYEISKEEIAKIKQQADELDKVEPLFHVKIIDDNGKVIAEVDKLVSVKRKDKIRSKSVDSQ